MTAIRKTLKQSDEIHRAAYDGDLKKVTELLSAPLDPNYKIGPGRTALHCAAGSCEPEIVRILIKNNADVNARDDLGETPLHYAVRGMFLPYAGDQEEFQERDKQVVVKMLSVVEILASNGAKINARNNSGTTPINSARFDEREIIKQVLEKFGSPKGIDPRYVGREIGRGSLTIFGYFLIIVGIPALLAIVYVILKRILELF